MASIESTPSTTVNPMAETVSDSNSVMLWLVHIMFTSCFPFLTLWSHFITQLTKIFSAY